MESPLPLLSRYSDEFHTRGLRCLLRVAIGFRVGPNPGVIGLSEVEYPLHDKDILVTACGRLCMHRKKMNISTVMAGQRLGIKEVDDGIWLVSFMH